MWRELPMSENPKVFLSVGRTCNDKQEMFVQTIEKYLQMNGLTPQTVGRTYFSSQQPLVSVAELMHQCAGTIVLAFERIHLVEAIEKRGNPQEARWEGVNLPTVWNQIEASMGYVLGHPLLVIVEENMKYEGLLEKGYDWYVKKVNLDDNILADSEFIGVMADWKRRVDAYQQQLSTISAIKAPQARQVPQNLMIHLHKILAERFSPGDLETLCLYLSIHYDNLGGEEHKTKALHLIQELERTNRIDELIKVGQEIRPDIIWELT
jgi:hypothetical protein